MQSSDIPSRKFPVPFAGSAGSGYIRNIPVASQIGITNGAASLTDGFPPLNFLPVRSGGIPPFGQDFNGILNQVTEWLQWQNAGGLVAYDSDFSDDIGGYPKNCVLASTTAGVVWLNLADNNTTDPDGASPSNWVALPTVTRVQSGYYNYAVIGGTANALTATLSPSPASLVAGMTVRGIPPSLNTGPVTINVNSIGPKTVVNAFGAALVGGEMIGVIDFLYDGTQFWASVTQPSLSANRTYYVNASTGSDSNNGITAGTAFATIQKAVDVSSALSLNGFSVTISVANGNYASFQTNRAASGGTISIVGNNASPQSVVVSSSTGTPGVVIGHDGYSVSGISPQGAAGQSNISVFGAAANIGTMYHSGVGSGGAHIASGAGGTIFLSGSHFIAGGAGIAHIYAADGGSIRSSSTLPTVSILSSAGFGAYAVATNGSMNVLYASITNPGNATGPRYNASLNGVINTNGGGANYYPGSTSGTTSTGGQYA